MARLAFRNPPYNNRYLAQHPHELLRWGWYEIRNFMQRGWRGYARSDLWDVEGYLRYIAVPMLRWMQERGHSYPADEGMTPERWAEILGYMIDGFEAGNEIMEGLVTDHEEYERLNQRFKNGMVWFTEYFLALWN